MIKSVLAIIKKDNNILFLKRHSYDRTLPNVYCLPGGKVDKEESFEDALKREVFEETGLTIKASHELGKDTAILKDKHFEMNFFLVEVSNFNIVLSDEHESYKWIKLEDIINENIAEVTKAFLCTNYNIGKEMISLVYILDSFFSDINLYRKLTGKNWYQHLYRDWDALCDSEGYPPIMPVEDENVPIVTEYRRRFVKY